MSNESKVKTENDRIIKSRAFALRGVIAIPVTYIISVFVLGSLLSSKLAPELQFGVLLTLIISSTGLTLALTVVTIHYWVTWKIEMEKLRHAPIGGSN